MSPNVLKVGLIGFGLSGRYFHAPFLAVHPGFRLAKVVSSRPADVAAFDPTIETVASVDDLLADDSIQLIFICSPNETHFHYARAALEHHKHVVIEKPFALNEPETNQLLDLAEKRGLVAVAFQNRRWDADFLTIKRLLADDRLGNVLDYEARYDRLMLVSDLQSWKEQSGEGHGSLFNLGPHLIDQALHLFGPPESVWADIRVIRPNSQVEDCFTIRLNYPDTQVTLKSSLMVHQNERRFLLHGTAGSFSKGGLDTQEPLLRQNRLPGTHDWGREPEAQWGLLTHDGESERVESVPGNYMAFYDGLYDSVVHRAEPVIKPDEIRQIARVLALAKQSSHTGRRLPY
ncbi:MAG: Gfo/Idh/MocA family oxidoreductase [Cytophagaceae bacterium]|nr:Gfo/Idh/MocA family oxidoreductase [Cytophagaceae bacterium]